MRSSCVYSVAKPVNSLNIIFGRTGRGAVLAVPARPCHATIQNLNGQFTSRSEYRCYRQTETDRKTDLSGQIGASCTENADALESRATLRRGPGPDERNHHPSTYDAPTAVDGFSNVGANSDAPPDSAEPRPPSASSARVVVVVSKPTEDLELRSRREIVLAPSS